MADETFVRNGLASYAVRIRQVAERGYGDWLQSSDRPKLMYERTRANVRFDHVARHAHVEFGSDRGVRIIAKHETVKLVFCDGQIVLRFKHADEDGLGVNGQETQSVLEFIDSEQPDIPGLPEQHRVECCFRQNDLDTALDSVTITARHRYKKLWSYELPKPQAEILPFTSPTSPDQGPPKVRQRLLDKDTKKESDKDSNG